LGDLIICVYISAVGHFDYSGDLDTCIAIRTMMFKNNVAYLQGKKFDFMTHVGV
jgi:hypothetical protein